MKIKYLSSNNTNSENLALLTLSSYFEIVESKDYNVIMKHDPSNHLKITQQNNIYTINYGSMQYLMRGFFKILSSKNDFLFYEETEDIKDFRIMIDCSRNAAFTVKKHKENIAKYALLGYNTYSLYLEDMYEIDSYPAFGLYRGRYSIQELQEIDDFADKLGVKVVASIQTLGHLSQIFHYRYFDKVKDTPSNLLVDSEETYKLIDAMISSISKSLRTREIMIGMDEVHSLGRGNYIDKYKYEEQYTLFLRHLYKVCEICSKYGYNHPVVWSDMFIKLNSKTHSYLDTEAVVDPNSLKDVPDCKVGYWDYDTVDVNVVNKMIEIHKNFANHFCLVTGLTTWFTPIYKHWKSIEVLDCFSKARKMNNIDDFIVTIWGDDGAYCNPDSYLIGAFYLSERVYTLEVDESKYDNLFGSYEKMSLCGKVDFKYNGDPKIFGDKVNYLSFAKTFYDDPLYGHCLNNELSGDKQVLERTALHYHNLSNELESFKNESLLYELTYYYAKACEKKIYSRINLVNAYFNNKSILNNVIDEYKNIIDLVKQITSLFEKMWLDNFKTYGLEVILGRHASMIARYEQSIRYLQKYLKNEINCIDEIEEIKKELPRIKIKDFYCNIAVITTNR